MCFSKLIQFFIARVPLGPWESFLTWYKFVSLKLCYKTKLISKNNSVMNNSLKEILSFFLAVYQTHKFSGFAFYNIIFYYYFIDWNRSYTMYYQNIKKHGSFRYTALYMNWHEWLTVVHVRVTLFANWVCFCNTNYSRHWRQAGEHSNINK